MSSKRPFDCIEDPLNQGNISSAFPNLIHKLSSFKTELSFDSYAQMGKLQIDEKSLKSLEKELYDELAIDIQLKTDLKRLPRPVLISWLKAARLETLYRKTVGHPEETISSISLKNYPKFIVFEPQEEKRLAALKKAYQDFEILPHEIHQIEKDAKERQAFLSNKLKLVQFLKQQLDPDQLSQSALKLLNKLWPNHPFREGELDIIATPTGVYFCFLGKEDIQALPSFKERTAQEQEELLAFIKLQKQFKFEQFEHFPMFSSFDSRDTCPDFLEACSNELPHLEHYEVCLLLNTVVTFEDTAHIEKYLIHDTWGHIWQHDLTDLNLHYDIMANMNRPISPFDDIIQNKRVIAFADLFNIDQNGKLKLDQGLKNTFIVSYLEKHISSIFAPIIAELTADVVEYFFWNDDESHRNLLPSSSLFKHNPTKLDFAWMDMSYFCKKVKGIHSKILKSQNWLDHFTEMLHQALKLKHSRKFKTVVQESTFKEEITKHTTQILKEIEEQFSYELEQRNSKESNLNSFDRLLSNLLRIQFASNKIIEDHLFQSRSDLLKMRETLILFICTYFCNNPEEHFWNLDETLASTTLPFLQYFHNLEENLQDTL